MFTMSDLFPKHEGAKIKILNQVFTLHKKEYLSGYLATWTNSDIVIQATPFFDRCLIPVEIENVDFHAYDKEIFTYEEYVSVVKELSEEILKRCSDVV
jgi:hypothetical protein